MEKTLKDVMSERVDTKIDTILAFDTLLQVFQKENNSEKPVTLEGNEFIILTNFGSISCELATNSDDEALTPAERLMSMTLKTRDERYKTLRPDIPIITNGKTLLVKNAVIRPFAAPANQLRYSFLTLFTDQIVGVTIGKYN